jgi:hypothetical protein
MESLSLVSGLGLFVTSFEVMPSYHLDMAARRVILDLGPDQGATLATPT